jgi:sentrin-specific protease 1
MKMDIFALDKIIVPVHLGTHWCLAVINMRKKRVEYYDSLGGTNSFCREV